MSRDARLGPDQRGRGGITRPPRRPPVAQQHVAKVVCPVAERSTAAFLDPSHNHAREVLRAAVVAGERVERLREPPPPGLERRPSVAVEPAIALRQLAFEQWG